MDGPVLCVRGCGFFGSSENRNMCSKCYLDFLKQETMSNVAPSPSVVKEASVSAMSSSMAQLSLSCGSDETSGKKKGGSRCSRCNKKVGLLGFACRCGDVFCGSHRYPEEHSCTVDFKALGRQILINQNPLCKADKLDRI